MPALGSLTEDVVPSGKKLGVVFDQSLSSLIPILQLYSYQVPFLPPENYLKNSKIPSFKTLTLFYMLTFQSRLIM